MVAPTSLPAHCKRIFQLWNFASSLKNQSNFYAAFDALDIHDQLAILRSIKVPNPCRALIEKASLRKRILTVTQSLMAKVETDIERISARILQVRPNYKRLLITFVDPQKTIDKLPEVSLLSIFSMAGVSPAVLAPVCKSFNEVQNKAYTIHFKRYIQDPRIAKFLPEQDVELLKEISPESQHNIVIKTFQHVMQGVEETGISLAVQKNLKKNLHFLDLGPLAEAVQRIKDIDFIIFVSHTLKWYVDLSFLSLQEGGVTPDAIRLRLKKISSAAIAAKTQSIRSWIYDNSHVLAGIKELHLYHFGLRTLPAEIGLCRNLQTLDLSRNHIRRFPPEFSDLSQLYWLNLSTNHLHYWSPELNALTKLRSLNLHGNGLRALPPEIGKFKNLRNLYLGNNKLKFLPREVGLLKLDWLVLSDNQLKSLPPLPYLNTMSYFKCVGNPLSFPSQICVICRDLTSGSSTETNHTLITLLETLLVHASKKEPKKPIQDRLVQQIKTITNPTLRKSLRQAVLMTNIAILDRVWHSRDTKEMLLQMLDLPTNVCNRIYSLVYSIEKRKKTKIDHENFGRLAFRNEGRQVSDPSIRSLAVQLTLLETLLELVETFKPRKLSSGILERFKHFDPAIKNPIYTYLHRIESKEGRIHKEHPKFGMLAFHKEQGFNAPDASRIKAIKHFLWLYQRQV